MSISSQECTSIEPDNCDCIIEDLLVKPFKDRDFTDKLKVISKGRPTPTITSLSFKTKACTRHLKPRNYDSVPWLCGCRKHAKLYCWFCVLFSNDRNIWNCSGVSDLNNLSNLQKRHEHSQSHILSHLAIKQFGKIGIEYSLSEQFKVNVEKQNELVKQNRYIVRGLIDVLCYLSEKELHCFDDSAETDYANYVGLINLLRAYNKTLDNHFKNSSVLSRLSNEIRVDLIDCITQILMDEIRVEVKNVPFVTVMLDEITDVMNKRQLLVVLRFVDNTGEIQERFVDFRDSSDDRLVNNLAQQVFNVLEEFKCENKVVAQSFDGSRDYSCLQNLIKERNNQTVFVQCYTHKINSVLKNSLEHIKECKIFFSSLTGVASFFSKLPKRQRAFNERVKVTSEASVKFNYNSKLVNAIACNKENLTCFFQFIIENGDKWDCDTYNNARGFYSTFKDFDFNFMLGLLESIIVQADPIFNSLRKNHFDVGYCLDVIEVFVQHLDYLRNDFNNFWYKVESNLSNGLNQDGDAEFKSKRIKLDESNKDSYERLYIKIIDVVEEKFKQGLHDMNQLDFMVLLDSEQFVNFSKTFPEEQFVRLQTNYEQYFDFPLLRSQLSVVYSSEQFRKNSVNDLLKYIYTADIIDVVSEVWKLGCLIATIPVTSGSVEKSVSAISRINAYLQNSQYGNRLSTLSYLSIEKNLLVKLKSDSTFYEKIIDLFARRHRWIDLMYKK